MNVEGDQLQLFKFKLLKLDICNWTSTYPHSNYVTNKRAVNQSETRTLLLVQLKYLAWLFYKVYVLLEYPRCCV